MSAVPRCATCRFWAPRDDEEYFPASGLLRNLHESTGYFDEPNDAVGALRDRVRICKAPRLHFYVAPSDGEAAVVDGSGYTGRLVTDQNFGCTLHEPTP